MCTRLQIIQGIPVEIDLSLPQEAVNQLVGDVFLSWQWEGRRLGKIELIKVEDGVNVCAYEQPCVQFVPLKKDA